MIDALELPVERPEIWCYNYYGCPLSILAAEADSATWFANSFHLPCFSSAADTPIRYRIFLDEYALRSPWLESNRLSSCLASSIAGGVRRLIVDCVSAGYYVYTFADEFFLPDARLHRQHHFAHDIMFYGYTPVGPLYVGMDRWNQWSRLRCTWEEIEAAYVSIEAEPGHDVHIWRRRPASEAAELGATALDLDAVCRGARFHLDSVSPLSPQFSDWHDRSTLTFGLASYERVAAHLLDVAHGLVEPDRRVLAAMRDHKVVVTARATLLELDERSDRGLRPDAVQLQQFCEEMLLRYTRAIIRQRGSSDAVFTDRVHGLVDDVSRVAGADRAVHERLLDAVGTRTAGDT